VAANLLHGATYVFKALCVLENPMSMTKAELVSIISEKCSYNTSSSAEIVEQVFQILKETLEKGETVKISGFGNFVVREKKPRKGRNPQTGGELVISGRSVLTFKPSVKLRKIVNQEGGLRNPDL
jgi:integration host factor subunit alpha